MSFWGILAIILGVVGILGSVLPGLPGPPISWVALLVLFIQKEPVSTTELIVYFVLMVVVTVLDYVIPAYLTKATGGHKAASVGAIVGLFAGMFIPPVGILAGSLLGAFLGEFLVENGGVWASFKASIGAFIGFIATTFMKLLLSAIILWRMIAVLFFN